MQRMIPRILLLENAKENAAPIVSHLEQLDWQVDFVQDGIDALVLGLTKHFDTLLKPSTHGHRSTTPGATSPSAFCIPSNHWNEPLYKFR